MIFLATPFAGSWKIGVEASQIRLQAAREACERASSDVGVDFVQYSTELPSLLSLRTNEKPSQLDELVRRFGDMVADKAFKIPVACFYETAHTKFSAYKSRLPKRENGEPTKFDGPGSAIVRTLSPALPAPIQRWIASVHGSRAALVGTDLLILSPPLSALGR
jgi:hypothetical protein